MNVSQPSHGNKSTGVESMKLHGTNGHEAQYAVWKEKPA